MFIVKLGGSVITDKRKKYCFQQKVMDALAEQIQKAYKELIIIHGAGSFGHILADEYQLNKGYTKDSQLQGFALTHAKVQELNSLVLQSLHSFDIPAVSIPPHAILQLDYHKPAYFDNSMFGNYLKKGFTPVTFGDVVLDETLGLSICSGDLLMQILAERFQPNKSIFVIDEDGLYSANPKINNKTQFIESTTVKELEQLTTTSNTHADVTEGMKGKINTIKKIAGYGIDTVLINGKKHNRLYDTLMGKETKCTLIHGEKQ